MKNPVLNTLRNWWYQKRNHKRIPRKAESKKWLDAFYTGEIVTPPVGSEPANVTPPGISGLGIAGAVHTVVPGVWTGEPEPDFDYLWYLNSAFVAQGLDFTPTHAGELYVVEVATNILGTNYAQSAPSNITVPGVPPSNATPFTVSGIPEVGQALTAVEGAWLGDPVIDLSYEWVLDGVLVGVGDKYTCTATGSLVVTEFAQNLSGEAFVTLAPITVTLPNVVATNATPPSISGSGNKGEVHTATPGVWDSNTPITLREYEWKLNTVVIGTAASVTPNADGNLTLSERVTNSAGVSEWVVSAAKIITTPLAPPTNTQLPQIIGNPIVGGQLSVLAGLWAGTAPITVSSYTWKQGGATVGTGTTFTPTAAGSVTVEERVSNAAASNVLATSLPVVVSDNQGPLVATGGTVTDVTIGGDDYKLHTFDAAGNFVVTQAGVCDVLLVGAGGAGGSSRGGGGGAGEVKQILSMSLPVGTYPVYVGQGGQGNLSARGGNGEATTFNGQSAAGGGGGGSQNTGLNTGSAGASGGGGCGTATAGNNPLGGAGSPGGAGGAGFGASSTAERNAGGGGGASAPGGNGSATLAGNGGNGVTITFDGTSQTIAGGGGGARMTGAGGGAGGTGGGGAGSSTGNSTTPADGLPGTEPGAGGGGGGGGAGGQALGGAGADGIVMIRYRATPPEVVKDPAVIDPDDVTITTAWLGGQTLNQLFTAQVDVAGVGRNDVLQWRIKHFRYKHMEGSVEVEGTDWANCPLVNSTGNTTIRNLGTIARPASAPGSRPLNHFEDDEDCYSIQFRKKIGNNPYSGETPLMAVEPPGPRQPNISVSTKAALISAINTGFAATGLYVIHLTADIDFGKLDSTINNSGKTKAGDPLIIRSANRASPRTIRNWLGDAINFNRCVNFIIDAINFDNTGNTETLGGPANGVNVANEQVPTGTAMNISTCQRAHVVNCKFNFMKFALSFPYNPINCYAGYLEGTKISNDFGRMLHGGADNLWQGLYVHDWANHSDPNAYHAGDGKWHTDFVQTGVQDGSGANADMTGLVMRNLVFDGRPGGYIISGCVNKTAANQRFGFVDCLFENVYVNVNGVTGLSQFGHRRSTMRNIVARRKSSTGTFTSGPGVKFGGVCDNALLQNCVLYRAPEADSGAYPSMSAVMAEVTQQRVTINNTSWPATWPLAGEPESVRMFAYAVGPNAYRDLSKAR